MDKNNHRIAVIGGGLSGLVIADGLHKKGYKKVTVFEKENRMGGKLHTIWYRGKSYELGGVFGLPPQRGLKALMKELNIKIDGPKMSRVNYDANGNRIMQIPREMLEDFVNELDRLPNVLGEYKSMDSPNIDKVEESLMVPFSEWCDINHFRVLKSVYGHYFTSYGLGDIDTVPALYVLRILNYGNLMSFMDLPEFFTWKNGVSSIIKGLSRGIGDIRFGQRVTGISKAEGGKLWINTDFEDLEFDGVLITAPLNELSHIYGVDDEIRELLNSIKYQHYNVFIFMADKVPRGCGCVLENLTLTRRGHVTIWNTRWEDEELITVYAYDNPQNSRSEALKIIKEDLVKMGIKNPRLYQYKTWKQCPYLDTKALQRGFYDRMEEIQGKNNIFFAGEIMSTTSMENCISYSKYLINKYF